MLELLLIRHGQSEADLLNVHEGRADFPLTGLGRRQAGLLAEFITEHYPPDIIWASTLKRAYETAVITADRAGCGLKTDERLMEFNNGVLAGMSREEAGIRYPEPPEGRKPHVRIEKGESMLEMRFRAETVLSELLDDAEQKGYKRIAAVSHGGLISMLILALLGLPNTSTRLFATGDTGVHLFKLDHKRRVAMFLNSQRHLPDEFLR
ncbi:MULTISPECIES: histidine phosphatase family protein [Bacillaceae]|uniref:histidine phosphatase family protein n=1 Tax=Bacillaceae TaxID=186817 RepID=UPI001CD697A1|nr:MULTISPECIES: histidine phosphatase family protein [Bacillus]MCA1037440.1 histidine phosphatase family protein [Bacillus infantis]MDW2879352.1 histidine phosphatase family protein [Bacillus infantis]